MLLTVHWDISFIMLKWLFIGYYTYIVMIEHVALLICDSVPTKAGSRSSVVRD